MSSSTAWSPIRTVAFSYTDYDILGLQSTEGAELILGLIYAGGALALRAGAKFLVRSLARKVQAKAAKRLLNPRFIGSEISGNPPYASVGRFAQAGHLRSYMQFDGEDVVYVVKSIWTSGEGTAAERALMQRAREANREMIIRAAEEAQKKGRKSFILRGDSGNLNFKAHITRLNEQIGARGGAVEVIPATRAGEYPDYKVVIDVAKVLESN